MRLLNKPGTASSNRGGWMMIATILIEAWDLYAISFLLVFITVEYRPTAVELGLATAAVQGGALIGALLGGYVADRLGRKRVFIITMILFIVLAIAQGFSMNIWDLIIIRFLLGIPLGSDIANGYAYIMESMSKGAREKMGTRWQFMFGLGEVFAILIITVMYITGLDHGIGLRHDGKSLSGEIADDGIGLEETARAGNGLPNMRARASSSAARSANSRGCSGNSPTWP